MAPNAAPMPDVLAAALSYAARGWLVVPLHSVRDGRCSCNKEKCGSQGKHPRVATGQAHLEGSSTDPEVIQGWWQRWPDANVGVITGPGSGVVVLDVDGEEGLDTLAQLELEVGPLPRTLVSRTGGGGRHYLFGHPGSGSKVTTSAHSLGRKLDIRGDGGLFVMPPSMHRSGKAYQWEDAAVEVADFTWLAHAFELVESLRPRPAPLPSKVVSFPVDREKVVRRAEAYLRTMDPSISGSGGHAALWRAACAMVRGFSLSTGEAYDLLAREFNPRCQPEWSEKELRHKVEAAEEKGQAMALGSLLAVEIAQPRKPMPEPPAWVTEECPLPDEPLCPVHQLDDAREPPPQEEERVVVDRTIFDLLDVDRNGNARKSVSNLATILRSDPEAPRFWFNSFESCIYRVVGEQQEHLDDDHITQEILRIEKKFKVAYSENMMQRLITLVANERKRNPLVEYLKGLAWDGQCRLASWLIDSGGAEDSEIVRAYSRKFLIQAVARAMEPGCKADSTLILVGKQGIRKSSAFHALAGPEFFVDSSIDLSHRSGYQVIARAWFFEFAELYSVRKSDIEATKAFLTSREDTFTPPYGRNPVRLKRHCVFCGSTNDRSFLKDPTGNRRFWPVEVGPIDVGWVEANRDQLWAEAVAAYHGSKGMDARWWLSEEEQQLATEHVVQFEEEDSWQPLVEEILAGLEVKRIKKADLAAELRERSRPKLGYDRDGVKRLGPAEIARDGYDTDRRIGAILKKLGWETRSFSEGGKKDRAWHPVTAVTPE